MRLKTCDAMKNICIFRSISLCVKREVFEDEDVNVDVCSGNLGYEERERHKVDFMEMKCL